MGDTHRKRRGGKRRLRHWHFYAALLLIYDIIVILGSYFFALWSRFDFVYSSIPAESFSNYTRAMPVVVTVSIAIFFAMGLYRNMWRFASVSDLERGVAASLLSSIFHIVYITVVCGRMPNRDLATSTLS